MFTSYHVIISVSSGEFLVTVGADALAQAQVLFPNVPLAVLGFCEAAGTEGAGVARTITRHKARQSFILFATSIHHGTVLVVLVIPTVAVLILFHVSQVLAALYLLGVLGLHCMLG